MDIKDTIDVLDHGFVKLVDVMGNDKAIVEAARMSVSGDDVAVTTTDIGLIRYLLRNRHTTPFEMVEFKFHLKMPIFVARQHIRHRMSSINEMSARYSVLPEEYYIPEKDKLKKQSKGNNQGRSDEGFSEEDATYMTNKMSSSAKECFGDYHEFLKNDLARETARNNLPVSTYTEMYWKIDLHNLLHYLSLRLDSHAQYEIRVFAEAIAEFVKKKVPVAWQAFQDFRINTVTLTQLETVFVSEIINSIHLGGGWELFPKNYVNEFVTKREFNEFLVKCGKLGLDITSE